MVVARRVGPAGGGIRPRRAEGRLPGRTTPRLPARPPSTSSRRPCTPARTTAPSDLPGDHQAATRTASATAPSFSRPIWCRPRIRTGATCEDVRYVPDRRSRRGLSLTWASVDSPSEDTYHPVRMVREQAGGHAVHRQPSGVEHLGDPGGGEARDGVRPRPKELVILIYGFKRSFFPAAPRQGASGRSSTTTIAWAAETPESIGRERRCTPAGDWLERAVRGEWCSLIAQAIVAPRTRGSANGVYYSLRQYESSVRKIILDPLKDQVSVSGPPEGLDRHCGERGNQRLPARDPSHFERRLGECVCW